jgi:AcrR family transcriptional regulator
VFARDGLDGATTRAISREAGVNEVTLFRHFGTKEHLIEEVMGRAFGNRVEKRRQVGGTSFREDLAGLAAAYEALLVENLHLIRAVVGEIHRHSLCEHQSLTGIFSPMREAMVQRIRTACETGEARPEINASAAADFLSGAIFASVLRRAMKRGGRGYRAAEYRDTCVGFFLDGIVAR